ncbi:MAG: hypothetical protein GF353_22235 [Candidatus Lokiarchaeota archaeon]|nr:hypothetical protein [Candidatus Lokiarchaeota archaeon]
MTLYFFLYSSTVDLGRYTIKDLPGSSGRLDVIVRCILSALYKNGEFEKNVQIWVFLENYGTYIFDTESLEIVSTPRNELLFTDFFVKRIKDIRGKKESDTLSLKGMKQSSMDIFDALNYFKEKNYEIFVLSEKGRDFISVLKELRRFSNYIFLIGDQTGKIISSNRIKEMNLPNLSLSEISYLASSVIRLIKLYLQFSKPKTKRN